MTLKLSKTAIRELKARFRAVIIATLLGSGVVISTSAGAATITIPETDGNVTGSGGATGTGTEYTIVDGSSSSSTNILTETAVNEAINTAVQGKANTSVVIDLGNSVDALDTRVDTNEVAISNINTALDGKQATLTTEQLAAVNSGVTADTVAQVATNKNAISNNETAINENADAIAQNKADITANANAIATNTADIAKNEADIATNAQNIATNATNITNNTQKINANTASINANANAIAQNASDIQSNSNAIATNANNIAENKEAISANKTAIAINTTNIAQNSTSITQNTQNISNLQSAMGTGFDSVNTVAKAIDDVNTNLNKLVSTNSTAGTITFEEPDGTTSTTYTTDKADELFAETVGNNTFTGTNTFQGTTSFGGSTTIDNTGKITAGNGLNVSGSATFNDGLSIGTTGKGFDASGNLIAGTITGTTISGTDITGTSLSVGTGSISGGSLVLSGTTVDGIDTGSNLTDATGGTTLATNATVYNTVIGQAENGTYTGTKVTGGTADTLSSALAETNTALNQTMTNLDNLVTIDSNAGTITITDTDASTDTVYTATKTDEQIKTNAESADYTGETVKTATTTPTTLKEAVSTTTAALNNVLNDAGEVDSAKVDVQWNGQDSTLQGVLGTGTLNEGNKNLTAGADVTDSLNALDATIGNVKDLAGTNLDQEADKTVQGHLAALDTAIGDRTNLNSANSAINSGTATDVASGLKAAGDAIGTTNFATTNGNIATNTTDLTTAVNELDAAIGNKDFTASSVNYTPATQGATLTEAIQTINANIGTAVTGANGNVVASNSINQNLDSLDTAIGNRQYAVTASTNYDPTTWTDTTVTGAINQVAGNIGAQTTTNYNGVLASNTVNANIDAINATIGDMNQMQNRNNNLAQGSSVVANLDSLDQAIGNRAYTSTNYISSGSDLSSAVSSLDSNLSRVEDEMNKMDHEMRSGFASLAALSALVPNARSAGDTQLSLGTGYYRGTTGFAVGAFHHLNDNVLLNAGAAYAGNGSATFRSGVTFGF